MVTDKLLHRIRAHLASPGINKAGLAKSAGLHPNTLRDADREDWNPTSATLRAVEHLLPPEDVPTAEWPIASANNGGKNITAQAEPEAGEADSPGPFSPTSSATSAPAAPAEEVIPSSSRCSNGPTPAQPEAAAP